MQTSLIVTTYNRTEALNLVLLSATRQRVSPHELIIADDGSGPETRELVERFAGRSPFPIRHVWQDDEGFRLSRARNLAIAASAGDYIIFVDGDMVLHPRFVEDHMDAAVPGALNQGSRVLLGWDTSARMMRDEITTVSFLTRDIDRRRHTIRSRFLSQLTSRITSRTTVKGCNQGIWRSDLVRVNGYNENFIGWGQEDVELGLRLAHSGVVQRTLKFRALASHLRHADASRDHLEISDAILAETARRRLSRCEYGLDQHRRAGS